MASGDLALVLHAHLPYVHSSEPGSLEEDWYFQALLECYLPLLEVLESAAADPRQRPRLSMGLSPTLLSLLSNVELSRRFVPWLQLRQKLLREAPRGFEEAAADLAQQLQAALKAWQRCEGNLLPRFQALQQSGVLDLLTCAATHGYLPLLRDCPEAVRAQLLTAVREHERLIGVRPQGIWLPECAYYEGLDRLLVACGLRYAILDAHGLLHGQPRPRYGVYAPICSPGGMAFFARDSEATLPVWSARDGYPGDAQYREFHRDLGWDLPKEELEEAGIGCPRPLGLKLHRVTGQQSSLEAKKAYNPAAATSAVRRDAQHYLQGRAKQLQELSGSMQRRPLLVAPFDAELFGHWWYEGPQFLAELFRQAPSEGVDLATLRDTLSRGDALQLCQPSPSSWGQGGYHTYWLNDSNAWVIPEWNRASRAMVERVSRGVGSERDRDLLNQAGRELLLAQSSDWSFILRAGTTTELAKERIHRHLDRFWTLLDAINRQEAPPSSWLEEVQHEDGLFPRINAADWARMPAAIPSSPSDT
ncbi:glycoside hydrolase family 57 protein [Vulcanococcus sp.]|uniref:glycoside hydrolase family 57 protein n=1 Tax=Vulcanococcus sp. TaxID=2856995 RepID=UPI003C03936F